MSFVTETGARLKAEHKWIFQNFHLNRPGIREEEYWLSPLFCAEGDEEIKWYIKLYPEGFEEKGKISAFLHIDHLPLNRSPLSATVSFTFHDVNGAKILADQEAQHTFMFAEDYYGWDELAELTDVVSRNIFSVTCTVDYCKSTTTSPLTSQSVSSEQEQSRSVVHDLHQLFTNRSGGDICFIVEGKEIKAHKLIVSARSSVLAEMFDSGMKEAVQNRVEIKDLTADIFEALLRFIYTDQVDLNKANVRYFLAAANKYLLSLLKFECQKFLAERLTSENCHEMLILADLHNAVHLKKTSIDFIRLNSADVMETEGWKDLKKSRPEFVADILESIYMS